MARSLSARGAFGLFLVVVAAWGLNWIVIKFIVISVSPFWTTAIRLWIAASATLVLLAARREFVFPSRADIPVVLVVALLHMGAFSTLVAAGLQFAPVGRSIVLGYTTPLFVAPGAWLLLRESMTPRQAAGICLGLAGLTLMFSPMSFDWSDREAVLGNALILTASLCWAANILYVRAHRWHSSPFQLLFWQALLAATILTALAMATEGPPVIEWTAGLASAFLYGGVVGTALAYWAMATVNRSLPAVTTSLGVLATPVVGVAGSALVFGERIDAALVAAMAAILAGIALGTTPARARRSGSRADR